MVPLPFNARLYDIQKAFERDDRGPLKVYLRSGTYDPDIQKWFADRMDSTTNDGHKLVIKGPHHRPSGGKAFDRSLAIAEAMNQLMNNPTDQRTEKAKVEEVRARFSCSASKVRKDYSSWKKARDFYPTEE